MIRLPRWVHVSLAVLAVGCGGGSGSGGGSRGAGARVDCAWFAGANCWKASAAAATACTDGAATGTFNAATTTCTYPDGNVVQFDPAASATASRHQDVPWNFTVLTSTAAVCARLVETEATLTLTTPLGTFVEGWDASGVSITCPDGTQVWTELSTALSCLGDLPGMAISGSSQILFSLLGAPAGDAVLWRCQ